MHFVLVQYYAERKKDREREEKKEVEDGEVK